MSDVQGLIVVVKRLPRLVVGNEVSLVSSMADSNPSGNTEESRLERFRMLREMRDEGTMQNFALTQREDSEIRRNPAHEARLERRRTKALRKLAKLNDQVESVFVNKETGSFKKNYTVEETERWRQKEEMRTSRRDEGFTDHAHMAIRKYARQSAAIDPKAVVERIGNTAAGIAALQASLIAEDKIRAKRSRRVRYDDSADVTYINERNARFNQKVSRAYDAYTEDLRESLERGTAL